MESNEMKVRSIRADETTLEKFKALSEEFPNQGECLAQLITAYEISTARQLIPNMETDIADFQANVDKIQQAYIHALELNTNAEQRIRAEFRHQLESKDKLIENLQERSERAEQALAAAQEEHDTAESDYKAQIEALNAANTQTQAEVERWRHEADSALRAQNDKQVIIDGLNKTIADNNTAVERARDIISSEKASIQAVEQAEKRVAELEKELTDTRARAEEAAAIAAERAENDKIRAVLEAEKAANEKVKEHLDTIAELNKRIAELTKQAQEQPKKKVAPKN